MEKWVQNKHGLDLEKDVQAKYRGVYNEWEWQLYVKFIEFENIHRDNSSNIAWSCVSLQHLIDII
jgi:hypothetical protein